MYEVEMASTSANLTTKDLQDFLLRDQLVESKQQAAHVVRIVFIAIQKLLLQTLQENKEAKLRILNFGRFIIKETPGGPRNNPKTRQRINTIRRYRISFKPCMRLKAILCPKQTQENNETKELDNDDKNGIK